jgi:hypothetical protein
VTLTAEEYAVIEKMAAEDRRTVSNFGALLLTEAVKARRAT